METLLDEDEITLTSVTNDDSTNHSKMFECNRLHLKSIVIDDEKYINKIHFDNPKHKRSYVKLKKSKPMFHIRTKVQKLDRFIFA